MRAFLGLPLPDEVTEDLARRAASAGTGRAIAPGNLHLTLAFLDDQPLTALAALDAGLRHLVAAPVRLEWGPPDFLGGGRRRVLALTVLPAPELLTLHARVGRALREAGIALPAARFRPHVSLLRLPASPDRRAQVRLQGLIMGGALAGLAPVTVGRFALYRSHLASDGARYEILADYPLGDRTGLDAGTPPGP